MLSSLSRTGRDAVRSPLIPRDLERRPWETLSVHSPPSGTGLGSPGEHLSSPQAIPAVVRQALGGPKNRRCREAQGSTHCPMAQNLPHSTQQDLPGKVYFTSAGSISRTKLEPWWRQLNKVDQNNVVQALKTILSLEPQPKNISQELCTKHKQVTSPAEIKYLNRIQDLKT